MIVLKDRGTKEKVNTEGNQDTHKQPMQENEVERKRNTNLKGSSSTSIVWVLELIDRTLVYGVFLLQVDNEDRVQQENTENTER